MAESVVTIAHQSVATKEGVNNLISRIINDKCNLSRSRTSINNDISCFTIVNSDQNQNLIRDWFILEVVNQYLHIMQRRELMMSTDDDWNFMWAEDYSNLLQSFLCMLQIYSDKTTSTLKSNFLSHILFMQFLFTSRRRSGFTL